MSVSRRHVRIAMSDDLLTRLDEQAAEQGLSRSDLVCKAVEAIVVAPSSDEISRQIVEGYRRIPPDEDDPWADNTAIELIREEPWNDVRFGGSTSPAKGRGPSSS